MDLSFLTAFFVAFGIIFVAEIGDKTQLIVLTLATKGYDKKMLAFGATLGFAVIVFLGGLIAKIIMNFIDLVWLSIISGIAFLIIGIVELVIVIKNRRAGVCEDVSISEDDVPKIKSRNSFLIGLGSIVIMEMGDKTQLMTIILASTSVSFFGTLFGSWAALSSLAVIGAVAGDFLSKKLSKDKIDLVASILFIFIGAVVLIFAF